MQIHTSRKIKIPELATSRLALAGLALTLLFASCIARAQTIHAWKGTITIPTYKLGPPDPDPPFALVNEHPIYPYPMLDDLSDERVMQTYQAIYLENQYLKITILPELGGHVYSVYDKLNQREALYRNNVIKYGLVGPRGAWIGGGMEFSFPFAHTTDTVSKVESTLHQNADGSATAVIGAVDWVSNMYWEIALTLRPDTARLEESVTLFNATPLDNLYLFWTNTAVNATDDMQYIYPMRETISDDPFAIVQSWPVWQGVDQSFYKNDPSALAIFARDVQRNFFGVYYHQANYGVVHVADFRQDPGKKVWTWGTAPSGKIWDHILSDDDGPYNEIQSGRFATQGYREFMKPHRVERWTEYWYPVAGLDGGFLEATNQLAVNAIFEKGAASAGEVKILLSPVAAIPDVNLLVCLGTAPLRTIHSVNLVPMHPLSYTIPVQDLESARKSLNVQVQSKQGEVLLQWSASVPVDGNPDFVPSAGKPLQAKLSVRSQTPLEELYLNGLFLQKKGDVQGALRTYEQVLKRDPHYIPALLQQAFYAYRAADFQKAESLIQQAQQRDTENPMVAYAAGLVYRAEQRLSLAKTAFWSSIHYGAGSSPGLALSPAYIELGEIAIQQADYAQAVDLFQHAVDDNAADALALTDLAVAERLSGDSQKAAASSAKANQQMPLLPYALAEHWLDVAAQNSDSTPASAAKQTWIKATDSDPENYLAVAAWYHAMGAWQSSDAVLHAAIANLPKQDLSPMIYYYLASNARQQGNAPQAARYSAEAMSLPIAEVFPNRITDATVLTEAIHTNPQDAHASYALANLLFAHARYEQAAALWSTALGQGFENPVLLRNLGVYEWHVKHDLPSAADYYARAIQLRPADYRLYSDIDEIYEEEHNSAARAKLFEDAPAEVLNRDTVRARHALFLIEESQPKRALTLLVDHRFKPWEGGVVIHNMFVFANMETGKKLLAEHKPEQAAEAFRQAMLYPENLGTGQPAQPELAEQFYWLGIALESQGKTAEAATAWQTAAAEGKGNANVFAAQAYRKVGQNRLAAQILEQCIEKTRRSEAVANDYFVAGLAEQFNGHAKLARTDYHHALEIEPLLWQARVADAEMNKAGQSMYIP